MSKAKTYRANTFIYFGIFILCFIFYGNTLKNLYNIDDTYVIVNQPLTNQGVKAIPQIFSSKYVNTPKESHSYRPVTLTSFAVEYQFFKANPYVSHFINIILYGLCCFMIFRLVMQLKPSKKNYVLSLVTTGVFLVLPIHSEVLNNVKCRDELLCLLFALSACIQFLKFSRNNNFVHVFFALFLIIISLLSKVSSLPILILIPLCIYFFSNVKKKKILIFSLIAPLLLISLRFLKKTFVDGSPKVREIKFFENPLFDSSIYSFADRIPVAISTFGKYVELLIFPRKLISYYGYNQFEMTTWANPQVWLILALIIGIFVTIIHFWDKKPLLVFGLLWFCISISMFLNLVKPVVGIIGDRFTFFASFGFALVIGCLLISIYKSYFFRINLAPKLGLVIVVFGLTIFSFIKITERNKNWYDLDTLLRNDVEVAENSAKLNAMLANRIFREVRAEKNKAKRTALTEKCLRLYRKCIAIYPGYFTTWNNMGSLVLNEYQDYKLALTYYQKAIAYKPTYKDALFGAGYANEMLGNIEEAINYYGKLLALKSNHFNAAGRILKLQKQE